MALLVASTRILPVPAARAVELLHGAGFDRVDVNYASVDRQGVDYPSVTNVLRLALFAAERVGVEPSTLHAPWEDYYLLYLGKGLDYAVAEARALLDIAAVYGVKVVVFHGFSSRKVGLHRVEWLNKRFFAELAEYAEEEGLPVIAVENSSGSEPLNRLENLARLVASIDSPKLGYCFDTGHAHLNGYSLADAARILGSRPPACLHVHDNRGSRDEHLHPGCGSIDWSEAGKAQVLGRAPYLVLESDCRAQSVSACLAQAGAAAAAARYLLNTWLE